MVIIKSEREEERREGRKNGRKGNRKEGEKEGREGNKGKREGRGPTTSRPLIMKFQNIRSKRKLLERQTRFFHYMST